MLHLEARCPYPLPEDAGFTIEVSSPCYGGPWYVISKPIHKNLGVSLLPTIGALTAAFTQSYLKWELPIMTNWQVLMLNEG